MTTSTRLMPTKGMQPSNNGYVTEGVACYVYSSPAPDTTPLYQLVSNISGDHYTIDADERDAAVANNGYVTEGVVCYVYSSLAPGTTPLYQLVNNISGDHFYTIDVDKGDAAVNNRSYVYEGVALH